MKFNYLICLALATSLCACQDTAPTQKKSEPKAYAMNHDSETVSGENSYVHAAELVKIGDRRSGSAGFEAQYKYISSALKKYGWEIEDQIFTEDTPHGQIQFKNLRARFGKNSFDEKAPKIIVSCHVDTKVGIPNFVGANDGASGAAVLIEIGRMLAKQPEQAKQVELVFFDGEESFETHMTEEDGLYGSKYYAESLGKQLPEYLINLDMVGRQGMKIRIPSNTSPEMYKLYQESVKALGFSKNRWGVSHGPIYDDHVPFQDKRVKVINLIDDFYDGSWWHTEKDNMSILSADSMKESGQMALHLIQQLLNK